MKFLPSIFAFCIFNFELSRAYTPNDTTLTVTSDGSYVDTSNAWNYVTGKAQDNWVITVGSANGDYTWPATLSVGNAYRTTLQGVSSNGMPTLRFNHTDSYGIFLNATSNLLILKWLAFTNGASSRPGTLIGTQGNGKCSWITQCHILDGGSDGIGIQYGSINTILTSGPFGLINKCVFSFPGGRVYDYLQGRCNGNGVTPTNYPWTQNMTWGTADCVVVEDCIVTQPSSAPVSHFGEGDGGWRFVLRHSTIENVAQGTHGFPSGANCSTLQVEVYSNLFVLSNPLDTMPYMFWSRGGSSIVFGNRFVVSGGNAPAKWCFWTCECANSDWSAEGCASQAVYPADYPFFEQVGRGVVDGVEGYQTNYAWANTFSPSGVFNDYQLGKDGGDAPFVTALTVVDGTVKPGYTPLAYPLEGQAPYTNQPSSIILYPRFVIQPN